VKRTDERDFSGSKQEQPKAFTAVLQYRSQWKSMGETVHPYRNNQTGSAMTSAAFAARRLRFAGQTTEMPPEIEKLDNTRASIGTIRAGYIQHITSNPGTAQESKRLLEVTWKQ